MSNDYFEYVHPRHFDAFVNTAAHFRCHILLRKTGYPSLSYVGRSGYAAKRADLKAKTAIRNIAPYQLAGLVCSPQIHRNVHKDETKAKEEWKNSTHLITIPPNGFDDSDQPKGIPTPYVLQTNRNHRHYGCVAWVQNGLMLPRYVCGDYDLYALIPEGRPFTPPSTPPKGMEMRAWMDAPMSFTLAQRVARDDALNKHVVTDLVTSQGYEIAMYLSLQIDRIEGTVTGGLMINHGEQVNCVTLGQTREPVLAFYARPRGTAQARILNNPEEHERFYREA